MRSDSEISHISLPVGFIRELSQTKDIASTLDCVARWLPQIIPADRASICLDCDDSAHLQVYAFSGNGAIPLDTPLIIADSLVGRVYQSMILEIADDLSEMDEQDCQSLAAGGLATCMDAPLQKANICFGTLNIAHSKPKTYTPREAVLLECIADWVANHLFSHRQLSLQKKLATTDPLTGISNRRKVFKLGQKLMTEWLNHQTPFVLIMMDLDQFKDINDQHGHDAGDCILREFSRTISPLVREEDEFARIGGEEFMILVPDSEITTADFLAERLQEAMAKLAVLYENKLLSITMSIGITQVRASDEHFDQVFCRTDKALYQSKQQGRNQITTY